MKKSKVKSQKSKVWKQKIFNFEQHTSYITVLLLFIVYCSLFTVTTGCGKKAPPKPPKETTLIK